MSNNYSYNYIIINYSDSPSSIENIFEINDNLFKPLKGNQDNIAELINEILPNSICISKYDVLSGNILLQSANKKIKKEFKIENDE